MDLDGPRESESMSMDVDDGAVPRCHPHRSDSVKMSSPGPSGGRMPFDSHPQNHQIVGSAQASIHSFPNHPPPDCERLPGSVARLSPPSSFVNRLGKTHDIYQNPEPAGQHRDPLPGLKPSVQDVAPPKRKRTHDLPHTHIIDHDHFPHDDASTDSASSQSRRRKRLRRRTQQDCEFSPLLIMSPGRELDPHAEEETFLATFPTNVISPSHSIRRHFHLENLPEQGPRTLQSTSSPKLDEDGKECGRSDSVSSFAEVALASTANLPNSRLSSLQDFELPRPFEDTDRPSLSTTIKVHERGLEAPPLFFPTSGDRMGGPWASRESAGSQTDALGHPIRVPQAVREHDAHAVSPRPDIPRLEPGLTNFFGKPLCESPESMDEDARARFGLPSTQVAHGAHFDSTPRVRSDGRTTSSSDGR